MFTCTAPTAYVCIRRLHHAVEIRITAEVGVRGQCGPLPYHFGHLFKYFAQCFEHVGLFRGSACDMQAELSGSTRGMETRTPARHTRDTSGGGRSRHGCVVLCSGNDVQIKLGSSSNLAVHPPAPAHQHRRRGPHQLRRRPDVDDEQASSDTEVYWRARGSAGHVEPSAPGDRTLLCPWTDTAAAAAGPGGRDDDSGQTGPAETARPPPFNPSCPTSETSPPESAETSASVKSAEAAHQDDERSSRSGCTTSSSPGDATAPPSYDELYGEQTDHQDHDRHPQSHATEQQQQQETSFQSSSVTRTTTGDSASGVCPSSLPCVAQFGHYVDPASTSPQPGSFTSPTRISVRDDHPDEPGSPTVMVVDPGASAVHLFTSAGDCLSLLRVPRVNGGCLVGGSRPLLLLAVGTSVCVYETDGRPVKEIPLSGRRQDAAVLTTVAYGERGFVSVRSRSLSIFRGGITRPAMVHTLAGHYRTDQSTAPFVLSLIHI